MDFTANVLAGAKWLDENGPLDWRSRINFDQLDMMDSCNCIIGQVFRSEAELAGTCCAWCYGLDLLGDTTYELGFQLWYGDYTKYTALTAAWVDYLTGKTDQ